jgi:16S rRNA G527 N7-methylase RsmG
MSEQGLSVVFSEDDIMTPAGSTATVDVDVGSGAGTPSQIDLRLATAVLESRNIMDDVESVTSKLL